MKARKYRIFTYTMVGFALAMHRPATAEQYSFVGARATGMGGANAASVHDATAQWHNPAVLGFMNQKTDEIDAAAATTNEIASGTVSTNEAMEMLALIDSLADTDEGADDATTNEAVVATDTVSIDGEDSFAVDGDASGTNGVYGNVLTSDDLEHNAVDGGEPAYNMLDNNGLSDRVFGWNLIGAGIGYTMTEDMGDYLDILDDIDFDAFDAEGLGTDADSVKSMLSIGSALYGMSEQGNAIYVDGSAGSSMRIGHFAIGVRFFGEATAYVDELDDTNFGIDQSQGEFTTTINDIALNAGFNAGAHTISTLSASQVADLNATLGNADAVKYIDYQLGELLLDGTYSQKDVDNAFNLVNKITFDGNNSLDDNRSTMLGRAFGVVEVPLSYGREINENLSVGITIKGMYGTVTGAKVWFFDEDSTEEAIDVASENTEGSFNFGLDLGLLYRIPNFQFALTGHNLNSPKFSGFTDTITIEDDLGNVLFTEEINIPDVRIDPQVTLGAAWIPSERFTLEANLDLLETGTLLNGYDIQRLSFGGEVDLWLLALRLGAYRNLATDWQDWVATAGVGLNLYIFRIDVGGAYSLGDPATYDGQDIPTEARLYAGLSFDF